MESSQELSADRCVRRGRRWVVEDVRGGIAVQEAPCLLKLREWQVSRYDNASTCKHVGTRTCGPSNITGPSRTRSNSTIMRQYDLTSI